MPEAKQVARNFSTILRSMLLPNEFESIVALNRKEKDPGVCHSHDYCDANMAMMAAMMCAGMTHEQVSDHMNLEIRWLRNDAWKMARDAEFEVDGLKWSDPW